jgi:hypothetical protein
MNHKAFTFTLLSAAVLAVGCNKEETTSQQVDKVAMETTNVAQNMKDYTFAQKADFNAEMQLQLTQLNKDLDVLSAKIDDSSDAVKAEAKPKVQALRDEAAQLNMQLDKARDATESTWDSVKDSSRKSYNALAADFAQARQWTSDKIAP